MFGGTGEFCEQARKMQSCPQSMQSMHAIVDIVVDTLWKRIERNTM
jgi:hypothetical protein